MLGREKFMGVDIRVRVKGGGHVSQTYGGLIATQLFIKYYKILFAAIRQAISKSLVSYYQKCRLVVWW